MSGAKMDGSAKLELLYKDPYQVLLKVFQKQKTKGKVHWEPQNLRYIPSLKHTVTCLRLLEAYLSILEHA
jgi:hypothetical protein